MLKQLNNETSRIMADSLKSLKVKCIITNE